MEMLKGSVTDGNSSEKTAKLLSEIRSIIRLQKCLSTIFLLKDGGEKCNEKCDAEQELLSSRLDDFERKMAADRETDVHVRSRCLSIVRTVSALCPRTRAVGAGGGQPEQSAVRRDEPCGVRDGHAAAGRAAVGTDGRPGGVLGDRPVDSNRPFVDAEHGERCLGRGRQPVTVDTRPVDGPRSLGVSHRGRTYAAVVVDRVDDAAALSSGDAPKGLRTGLADSTILRDYSKVSESGIDYSVSRTLVAQKMGMISNKDKDDGATATTQPMIKDLGKQSKEKLVQNFNRFRTHEATYRNWESTEKFKFYIPTSKPWYC